jgi:hypothetical protein
LRYKRIKLAQKKILSSGVGVAMKGHFCTLKEKRERYLYGLVGGSANKMKKGLCKTVDDLSTREMSPSV